MPGFCTYCEANQLGSSDVFSKLGEQFCCSCGDLLKLKAAASDRSDASSLSKEPPKAGPQKPVSPCSVPVSPFLLEIAKEKGVLFGGRTGRYKDIAEFWTVEFPENNFQLWSDPSRCIAFDEVSGEVVGACYFQGKAGYIMALAVGSKHTGRRIAKLLIAVAIEHMQRCGSPHAHLLVTRDDALRTPHLHKLYRSMGFVGGNDKGSGHFTLHPIPDHYSRTALLAPPRAGAGLWDPPELQEATKLAEAAARKKRELKQELQKQRQPQPQPPSVQKILEADDGADAAREKARSVVSREGGESEGEGRQALEGLSISETEKVDQARQEESTNGAT